MMHIECAKNGLLDAVSLETKLQKVWMLPLNASISKIKEGPDYDCVSCHRVMYRQNAFVLNRDLKLIYK